MNQSNPYEQYGYDHYDQPPARKKGLFEKVFGETISARLRSPLTATLALLVTGAVFAGIIIAAYPDSSEESSPVPVVKAEATPFKDLPEFPGGMDVPNKDSTVFTTVRTGQFDQGAPVENLLEPETPAEEPVDKLAAFAEEAEELMDITETADGTEETAEEPVEATGGVLAEATPEPVAIKKIVQKTEKIPAQELVSANEAVTSAEKSAPVASPVPARPPKKLHAPASSPETLAFVRSVLDKKDEKKVVAAVPTAGSSTVNTQTSPPVVVAAPPPDVVVSEVTTPPAESIARIEPAAGAAPKAAAAVTPGDYFVQLASITNEAAAQEEWMKLQRDFAYELQNVDYRVQRADLGERGIYYRIQAGPMSKNSASAMCEAIKAQKPGGCLVTQ